MRKFPLPAAIAAAHAAKARRTVEVGIPLYLPGYDERLSFVPFEPADAAEDAEVDASGITVGGDDDNDLL